MSKIGNRTVTHEQSTKEIDWKIVAIALANDYLKTRCVDEKDRVKTKTG